MKHIFTLAFMAASMAMMAQVGLITWEVNMANETVSPEGVYIAGGDYFGLPGDNPMTDEDGDGVWTITMAMPLTIPEHIRSPTELAQITLAKRIS